MTLPTALAVGAGLCLLLAALVFLPGTLIRRGQDRLARERIAQLDRERGRFRLLTRAELVSGRYRRTPGVLGLTDEGVQFTGVFGESIVLASPRIDKISSGSRLASGRKLFRREVLRITRSAGEELEFVLTRESAGAWRSHLGLWTMAQRQVSDRVVPGG